MGMRSSGETSFVGGQRVNPRSTPANIRLQEEDEYRRAQLQLEGRSPEEGTSSR